ncbi:MAG TPA: MoaD/ThiS family protein [Planctomycetota bacterium]|nr:MoaD/ThiS family protein [Planctomycetota bacterium]
MNVRVVLTAQAREAAGCGETTVALGTDRTVRGLLGALADAHGGRLRSLLLKADGRPHPSVLVVVGDEHVPVDDPRALRDGDAVTVMTPIAGG